MPFRFNAKSVGLTYSCPVSLAENPLDEFYEKKTFVEQFQRWGNVLEWIVGQEKHERGCNHYHVYLKFADKLDTTDANFFDLRANLNHLPVHPNIIKSPGKGWIAYCAKHHVFQSNFYEDDPFATAANMEDPDEALALLWKKRPKDMCMHGSSIEKNLKRKLFTMDPLKAKDTFIRPFETDFSKLIIMKGKAGIGKTQFARAHFKRPLTCDQNDDLKNFSPQYDGIVLDDLSFTHHHINNQKKICDVTVSRSVWARNRDARLTPCPIIATCNYDQIPFDLTDPAIQRRVYVIDLGFEPLFL